MSNSTKIIIVFLVAILIIVGLWYFLVGKSQPIPAQNPEVTQSAATTTEQQPATPASAVSQRDDSNTSLDQDLNSIDSQLQTVDGNSASVSQSLNDTPVSQTE